MFMFIHEPADPEHRPGPSYTLDNTPQHPETTPLGREREKLGEMNLNFCYFIA